MIEILTWKDEPKKKQWLVNCPYCGCELKCDDSDIVRSQTQGDYLECPCCKNFIGFSFGLFKEIK